MFRVEVNWKSNKDASDAIAQWAKENCPSYINPWIRVVKTSIGGQTHGTSSSVFEFTDESDAIIFSLKWT